MMSISLSITKVQTLRFKFKCTRRHSPKQSSYVTLKFTNNRLSCPKQNMSIRKHLGINLIWLIQSLACWSYCKHQLKLRRVEIPVLRRLRLLLPRPIRLLFRCGRRRHRLRYPKLAAFRRTATIVFFFNLHHHHVHHHLHQISNSNNKNNKKKFSRFQGRPAVNWRCGKQRIYRALFLKWRETWWHRVASSGSTVLVKLVLEVATCYSVV